MSGPKVLSPEELRRQEEERERIRQEIARREELMRLVQDHYRQNEVMKRQNDLAAELQMSLATVLENPEAKRIADVLTALIRENQHIMATWAEVSRTEDNSLIRQHNEKLDKLIEANERQLNAARQPVAKMHTDYIEKKLSAHKKKPQGQSSHATAIAVAVPDIEEEFLLREASRITKQIQLLDSRATKAHFDRRELHKIRTEVEASLADQNRERRMIFEEIHRLDVFRLQPYQSSLEEREEENDALEAELSDALAKYHSLCSIYHVEPKRFPFRRESLEEIRYACGDLLEQYEQTISCEEVMERVQATLTDLGYRYIGQKEEDRKVYRQVYRIHDNTILHVIFDSTGRVTMEVAIEDDCDRLPYAREIESIVEEQGTFCRGFEQIVSSLDGNGLRMRKDVMCPCGAEFAQVINTSGFTKEEQADAFDYSIYEDLNRKYCEG